MVYKEMAPRLRKSLPNGRHQNPRRQREAPLELEARARRDARQRRAEHLVEAELDRAVELDELDIELKKLTFSKFATRF